MTGSNSICDAGVTGTYSVCDQSDPNATPVFASGAPAAGLDYTFRFDLPGTYHYFCAVHVCGGMRGIVIVNPASTACSGAACQQPMLRFRKVAAGQSVTAVCGYGAPAGAASAADETVLCWNSHSSSAAIPGVYHLFRDTQPNFAAPSPNFMELTDPTRQTCTPDYADADPLPAGRAAFYYRICDNAGCDNG
jgi:hypothetical protein